MIDLDSSVGDSWKLTWFHKSGFSFTTDDMYSSQAEAIKYGNSTLRYLHKRRVKVELGGTPVWSDEVTHFIPIPHVEPNKKAP